MVDWSVVQTQPQQEGHVEERLQKQGVVVFYPRLRKRFFRHGKQQSKYLPFFPTYLFVLTEGLWYSIKNCLGVTRVLMDGEKPAMVIEGIVESLQRRTDAQGAIILPRKTKFAIGQSVRIQEGPLEGQLGIYDGMSGRDRVRVLYELLGRKVPCVVNERDVVAA